MPDYTTTVGNVQLLALNNGGSVLSPLISFPDTAIEQWREFPELLDEHDQVRSRYGTTGVRSQDKLIIVDTGQQAPDGALMSDMRAKGVDPESVDLVVHTHLHPDHVGWNLTDGKPNFPNARYLVPRKDWVYWTQHVGLAGAAHVRDQVVPLGALGFIDLIDDDYQITDELSTVSTPGHVSIMIASGGERGYILGDVAHNPGFGHFVRVAGRRSWRAIQYLLTNAVIPAKSGIQCG